MFTNVWDAIKLVYKIMYVKLIKQTKFLDSVQNCFIWFLRVTATEAESYSS